MRGEVHAPQSEIWPITYTKSTPPYASWMEIIMCRWIYIYNRQVAKKICLNFFFMKSLFMYCFCRGVGIKKTLLSLWIALTENSKVQFCWTKNKNLDLHNNQNFLAKIASLFLVVFSLTDGRYTRYKEESKFNNYRAAK